jgi:hypothetical protein
VARWDGSAHARQLPRWIQEMNPHSIFAQQSLNTA